MSYTVGQSANYVRSPSLARRVIRSIISSISNKETRNASSRLNPVWGEQTNRYRVEGTTRSDLVGIQLCEEART